MRHHAVGVCMIYMVPFFLHFSSLLLTDPISRHDVALKQSSLPHWSSLPPSFYPLLWSIDHAWQSIMRAHWCFLPIKLSFFYSDQLISFIKKLYLIDSCLIFFFSLSLSIWSHCNCVVDHFKTSTSSYPSSLPPARLSPPFDSHYIYIYILRLNFPCFFMLLVHPS